MADIKDLAPEVDQLLCELDRRKRCVTTNNTYVEGTAPVPQAVSASRMVKSYHALMGVSAAPWASLVVDSVQDRLEVGGIRTGDKALDELVWSQVWQSNALDAESKLAHHSVLVDGRAFATVWPDPVTQRPEIVLDGADQVVVKYREGRHQPRHRTAALRRWCDSLDGKDRITLYRADALYKFVEAAEQRDDNGRRLMAGGKWWEMREEIVGPGLVEPWPLPNPFGVVPVVELSTNRRLKPGAFPYARGEFEHCLGLLDRINLLTFLGLVVAVWMGFPLRGVIGERILQDDDGNNVAPFDSKPDSVVQFENPDAKVFQLDAADRKNLSIFGELAQLAHMTKTPAHYFPLENGMSNISADAIRASEGGLHAKVRGIHKPFLGEGHEEVLRVAAMMLDEPLDLPPTAEVFWLDHESRSLAERADAALKIGQAGVPWPFVAEKYLNLTQEELARAETLGASSVLGQLLTAAQQPATVPAPEPAVA